MRYARPVSPMCRPRLWEYRTVVSSDPLTQSRLKRLSLKGWQLFAVLKNSEGMIETSFRRRPQIAR
jgi:hypothetical protein